jgi:integrase
LHPDQVSKDFRRLVTESDLPAITLQELRHTHATLALTAGIHPKIVSERLGHSSVSVTLDIYSHVLPNLQSEVAGVIADFAFGAER